jgi:hypothetical protein
VSSVREAAIEQLLIRLVRARGAWPLKLIGGEAGLPDRLVLGPGGRAAFVELKAPGKTPRPLQRVVHRRLRDLGFLVVVLDSSEAVESFVKEFLDGRTVPPS